MKKSRNAYYSKLSHLLENFRRFNSFLGIILLTISFAVRANICSNGYMNFNCENELVSPNALPFLGSPPELSANLTLIYEDGTEKPFIDGYKLPLGIELKIGMRIKVDYQLKNGLTEIYLSDGSIRSLPFGKFDADGDPIDNQKTYESIKWNQFDTESGGLNKILLNISHPLNELTITANICTSGRTLQVTITPFTYTGDPNQGEPYTLKISNPDGSPYIFKNCELSSLNEVAIQVKDQNGDYYIDETKMNPITMKETVPGDELSVFLMLATGNNYIDVTDHYISQIVWGYKIDTENKETDSDYIWMDGTQEIGSLANFESINTTGMRTFKIQDNNLNARAIHPYHKSEQSMRLVLKLNDK